MKYLRSFIVIIFIVLALPLRYPNANPITYDDYADSPSGAIKVVTTISVIADWAAQVGEGVFEPATVVSGSVDPHTYSPTAGQIQMISECDLFIRFGLPGLEPWVNDILESFPDLNVLTLASTDMMKVDNITGTTNPHLWMNPIIVKNFVENITTAVKEIDPEHSSTYEQNKQQYLSELDTLIAKIQGEYYNSLHGLKVVVYHPAFLYLFELLGIIRVGVIQEHEGSAPSAKHIQEIISLMKEENVSVLVSQPQISDSSVIQIARETNAKIAKLTPLLGVEDIDNYIDMIEYDIYALQHPEEISEKSWTTTAIIIGLVFFGLAVGVFIFLRYKK